MLYHGLIVSHINYCNIVWSNSSDYFHFGKKALRIISNASFIAHILLLFHYLRLLNVYDIKRFNIAIIMFLCSKGLILQLIMSKVFFCNLTIHDHNTRNSFKYHLPRVRTMISLNSIYFKVHLY